MKETKTAQRKRNDRSFYFDKYTGKFEQASNFGASVYAHHRKHRFVLLAKQRHEPSEQRKIELLKENGLSIIMFRKAYPKLKDLPF